VPIWIWRGPLRLLLHRLRCKQEALPHTYRDSAILNCEATFAPEEPSSIPKCAMNCVTPGEPILHPVWRLGCDPLIYGLQMRVEVSVLPRWRRRRERSGDP
jgi:hypothetical protein